MTDNRWTTFKEDATKCVACHGPTCLVEAGAYPLFVNKPPEDTSILFILEAPNRDDTFNPSKGYLTVEAGTDPSGKFLHDLVANELHVDSSGVFVTNSVLCLPARKGNSHPVSQTQRKNCSRHLRAIITAFEPVIVCTLGTKALMATAHIEDHGLRSLKGISGEARPWFGRTLYPLYHTSLQARHGPSGRPEAMQLKDWQKLRQLWLRLTYKPGQLDIGTLPIIDDIQT